MYREFQLKFICVYLSERALVCGVHANSLGEGTGFRESAGFFFLLLLLKTLVLSDSCENFSPSET